MPTLGQVANTVIPAVSNVSDLFTRRNGLNSATNTVTAAADTAGQRIDTAANTGIARWDPYAATGVDAVTKYRNLIDNPTSFDPATVTNEPGYGFGLDKVVSETDKASRGVRNRAQLDAQTKNILGYQSQRYNDAFNRFMATQKNQQDLIKGGVDIGTNATTQQNQLGTGAAEDRASLDLAVAKDTAANQVQGANNTANTIGKLAGTAQDVVGLFKKAAPVANTLGKVVGPGGATASIIGSTTGAGTVGAAGTAATTAGAVGAPATGITGALGLGGGSGLLGLGAATIPVVGGALLAGAAWLKSQAHWEANTAVKDMENPFHEKSLAPFAANWDQAIKSGALNAQQGHDALDQYIQNFQDYTDKIQQWAGNSSDKKKVAQQSIANLYKTTVQPQVARMTSEISQLRAA